MSPNSGFAPGFTNVQMEKTKKSAGHKRVASTIVAGGPPDIATIMQNGAKVKRDNFLQTQVVSPQLASMKA